MYFESRASKAVSTRILSVKEQNSIRSLICYPLRGSTSAQVMDFMVFLLRRYCIHVRTLETSVVGPITSSKNPRISLFFTLVLIISSGTVGLSLLSRSLTLQTQHHGPSLTCPQHHGVARTSPYNRCMVIYPDNNHANRHATLIVPCWFLSDVHT